MLTLIVANAYIRAVLTNSPVIGIPSLVPLTRSIHNQVTAEIEQVAGQDNDIGFSYSSKMYATWYALIIDEKKHLMLTSYSSCHKSLHVVLLPPVISVHQHIQSQSLPSSMNA